MKALVLLADGFEELEYFVPVLRWQDEGVSVSVATPNGQPATGRHGYRVTADTPIRELNPVEYDALLIPGGSSPERLRLREDAVDVARTFADEGRRIVALGHGVQLLISAGVINGRRVTCAESIRDDVRSAGAAYFDELIVVDGLLLTGRGYPELIGIGAAVAEFLGATV